MNITFSIVVPTYNRANLIGATLDSLLQQSFKDYEIIVVDDGSTDDTEAVVLSIKDPRIIYCRKENAERGAARNFGIQKAKGNYVTFIDSDDLMYPYALQNAFDNIQKYNFPYCFAQAFEVKDATTGRQIQAPQKMSSATINKEIIQGNFLACIGVFVHRDVLKNIHFEEDRLFAGTEDWLLWLRLAARYPFYYSNLVCAAMIEHSSRSVLSFSEEKLLYRTNFLKKKLSTDPLFIDYYGLKVVENIYAHMLTYTSLHLAIMKKNKKALSYLFQGIRINLTELFTRRTLGILKTIFIK